MSKYETVIGLEIHVETTTNTKMYSRAIRDFNAPVNSHVSVIDLAFPGTLPRVNKKAVENGILLSAALQMTIDHELHFDRKNYFYSDLTKGYQITQDRRPIGSKGLLEVATKEGVKTIRINRLHLEEDTAKQMHIENKTYLDYNRAGAPLVEIVTEPDIRTAEEAMRFVEGIREIVTYINVGDGKMEEGSLRCDVNISIREKGTTQFGTKVEVKNLNSIASVGKVIELELERQSKLLEAGKQVHAETRRYDESKKETVLMRMKDESMDYRYYPETNILPIELDPDYVSSIIATLPELPSAKRKRYLALGLELQHIDILLLNKEQAMYFDEGLKYTKDAKTLLNWIVFTVNEYLNKNDTNGKVMQLSAQNLANIVNLISEGKISNKQGRELFDKIVETNEDAETVAKALNLMQVSDESFILKIINKVIDENLSAIDDIKNGKDRALGFLVGQVMKKSQGKVNPALANELMRKEIAKR